jgi:hypothetical protein
MDCRKDILKLCFGKSSYGLEFRTFLRTVNALYYMDNTYDI